MATLPLVHATTPNVGSQGASLPSAAEWAQMVHYAETLRALNDRLRTSYEQLSSLLILGQAFNAAGSRGRVGEILMEIAREVLPYRAAALLLYEDETYHRRGAVDLTPELDAELSRQMMDGVLEWVREAGQPTTRAADGDQAGAVQSYAFLPLLFQQELVGVLWLALDEPVERLTEDRLQVADVIAGQAAAAFRNAAYADLEHSYQQLHALESIKDDLIHMIVHDLRSPLTVIMGNVETALFLAQDPRQKEILQRVTSGCEGMLTMIGNLLDVSRMEEGKLEPRLEEFPLAEVIQANLDILSPAAARWNKPIVCHAPEDLPLLHADRELMRRILANLLGNALKYSPPGKPIEIDARYDEERSEFLISVTDHGIGIAPEFHQKIFDKFGQIEAKQSRERVGSGLGLTFCRMAVEAHGGRIWVESVPEESFTSFRFTLPMQRA